MKTKNLKEIFSLYENESQHTCESVRCKVHHPFCNSRFLIVQRQVMCTDFEAPILLLIRLDIFYTLVQFFSRILVTKNRVDFPKWEKTKQDKV